MIVENKQIKSNNVPDDSRPWYDLSVSNGRLTVDTDGDGGNGVDLTGESIEIDTTQDSIVAVDDGAGLIAYGQGDDAPTLRAHLAWYDASADTVTILDFVE